MKNKKRFLKKLKRRAMKKDLRLLKQKYTGFTTCEALRSLRKR